MADRVNCPQCQAQLQLPGLSAEQTVQCPRCRQVFVPAAAPVRAEAKRAPLPTADEDEYRELERLLPPPPLTGEWKGAFACAMLALSVLLSGAQAWVQYEQIELDQIEEEMFRNAFGPFNLQRVVLAAQPPDPRFDGLEERHDRHRIVRNIVDPVQRLCHVVTLIAFTIWIVHASRNLRLLRANGLRFTPFSAAISLYIPIANLFQPYQSVMEIWRASEPNAVRSPTSWQASPYALPIRVWWFLLMSAWALALLYWLISDGGRRPDSVLTFLRGASCILLAAAFGLLIYIIHTITARQRERYDRLYVDAE